MTLSAASERLLAFREAIREKTLARGFHRVGFTTTDPLDAATERRWDRWRAAGGGADMEWLRREQPRRTRPRELMPEVRSILIATAPYHFGDHGRNGHAPPPSPAGRIARYAWGLDYHHVLRAKLTGVGRWIADEAAARGLNSRDGVETPVGYRAFADSAPLDERNLAVRAGLGFIGKNTLLLHPRDGSWFLLATLLLTIEIPPDEPGAEPGAASGGMTGDESCGSCRRCIEACPTGALDSPYELDAARCISWFTIEHRGDAVPEIFAKAAAGPGGDWLFGCDVCQEVCPFNAPLARPESADAGGPVPMEEFAPERGAGPWMELEEAISPRSGRALRRRLAPTPLARTGPKGLRRNARMLAAARKAAVREGGAREDQTG